MTYTDEQRAIIARMGKISRRFDETAVNHHAAQAQAGHDLIDLATRMLAVINQTGALVTLNKQHGDAFREFLDTL
jgi:hypothetical protein